MDRRKLLSMLVGVAVAPSCLAAIQKKLPVWYGIDYATDFDAALASGGEVTTYTGYLVGEQAAELFVPIGTVQKMWLGAELIYDRDSPTPMQLRSREETAARIRDMTAELPRFKERCAATFPPGFGDCPRKKP